MTFQDHNAHIEHIRNSEYPNLQDAIYLDHAGATLYSKSLMDGFHSDMMSKLYGNPHSASLSSQQATGEIETIRSNALEFFGFDPDVVDLIFTMNTTAAIKLLVEAFREHDHGFWYGYHAEAHTSLVGVRETAVASHCFEADAAVELWLENGSIHSIGHASRVFAYPAQSNMNGRRLPLNWLARCRKLSDSRRIYTVLDAASYAATTGFHSVSPDDVADFTVMSFTKVFGFPDLGALIVRKDAAHVFDRRRYFGGGTVDMAICLQEKWHVKKSGPLHVRLEDGTLPIHNILALKSAMRSHIKLFGAIQRIERHTGALSQDLHARLAELKHGNGQNVCTIYKHESSHYGDSRSQGPLVALNLHDSQGMWVSNTEVEKLASIRNIHLRIGGLCNPGGIATSLSLAPWEMRENFSAGFRCGADDDILNGKPTGMIRLSLGAMSTRSDVDSFIHFINEFFVDCPKLSPHPSKPCPSIDPPTTNLYIESLTVYPIKSCAGWRVPYGMPWDVRQEGLAWDREWCIVKPSSGAILSMKSHPRMALIQPHLDFRAGVLRIGTTDMPEQIAVPLSRNPSVGLVSYQHRPREATVCGDTIKLWQYTSVRIADFLTEAVGVPCTLARFPPPHKYGGDPCPTPSLRHSKLHLRQRPLLETSRPLYQAQPLLLSNESPILTISRSSLNQLNEVIKSCPSSLLQGPRRAVAAAVFRANIVLAETSPVPLSRSVGSDSDTTSTAATMTKTTVWRERPWAEDRWQRMRVGGTRGPTFDFLGGCRRCQMLCVDPDSGTKAAEPFATLAKMRRIEGRVLFGVHTALVPSSAVVGVTGEERGTEGGLEVGPSTCAALARVKSGDDVEAWS